MSRIYTVRCPHCGEPDCNVWTRHGARWYFCPHLNPWPCWNGSAWVRRDCLASNGHVPLMIAKHMRAVYRDATGAVRRWYRGRSGNAQLRASLLDRQG